jgi:hypothetical protein
MEKEGESWLETERMLSLVLKVPGLGFRVTALPQVRV